MKLDKDSDEILLSFILLNYNNIDYTSKCIHSIQTAVTVPYEIIVVDNASNDDNVEELRQIEGIKLVENAANRGFTGGNNDGVRVAKGKYVVILNNDTIVYDSNLNELPTVLDLHGKFDVVGGRMVGMDGIAQTSGGYEPPISVFFLQFTLLCYIPVNFPWLKKFWFSEWTDNNVKEVDWSGGCFFAMRRDAYQELGGFDENIFIYLDEVDLHKRARAKGGRVYLYHNFVIKHYGVISWGANSYLGVRHNYNSAAYYLEKYYSRFHKLLLILVVKAVNLSYLPVLSLICLLTLGRVSIVNKKFKICLTLLGA